MIQSKSLMGTGITIEIVDSSAKQSALDKVFSYFEYVDNKFSTFKSGSEISLINQAKIKPLDWSREMKDIFALAEITKKQSQGYFDIIANQGKYDPSGLVKGWAIYQAAEILEQMGYKNFYVNAGGDIQVKGRNGQGQPWSVGIRHPFHQEQIVKVIYLVNQGIATSGTYLRGQHIYNPFNRNQPIAEIVSLTVIGPDVCEADRFATAAFAMGKKGIEFIESLGGFEGYQIDKNGLAIYTSGFEKYQLKSR